MPLSLESCPCAGTTLDRLVRPAILAILAEGPTHGYRLLDRLAGLRLARGRAPDPTGVYRSLRAMQGLGLVTASWSTPAAGPASRQFALTADGRRCIAQWVATLEEYARGVQDLAGALRKASQPGRRAAARPRVRRAVRRKGQA